ncbi:MAG TPA: SHOCT domain-containing protein [Solirubrobacterales bacterium]|nr:SHOCT domain-containing protein [Solirubrobacterales bacterium]
MKYVIRTGLAMALFAFCWVLFGYSIYQLLQVGTCASGGPYEIARECPGGMERLVFSLIGSVLGLFIAAGIYLGRGAPPGASQPPQNAGIVIWFWTGLFWSLAAGGLLGVWGPDANPGPGGKEGGLIVGFMGLLMGAGGFLAVGFNWTRDPKKVRKVASRVAETASRFSGQAPDVDRIATLDRLRDQGTITDAEFEALKDRIVKGKT